MILRKIKKKKKSGFRSTDKKDPGNPVSSKGSSPGKNHFAHENKRRAM